MTTPAIMHMLPAVLSVIVAVQAQSVTRYSTFVEESDLGGPDTFGAPSKLMASSLTKKMPGVVLRDDKGKEIKTVKAHHGDDLRALAKETAG